ncbi:hypothetical protein PPSIR1_14360 [Plesiocystis pacifica SIR-1]|uniref:Uncharacterized protein n=1 Tax=Plesiocystis pacifica SIR-1 TaxID=391625 RepID=A6GH50_9BACT|nr:hypothetical protein [Plesiocystis pacifica]EDM74828.1 hypothetical protein PPSIR1_14360 [Plesiocystis pacifica SIR-1]
MAAQHRPWFVALGLAAAVGLGSAACLKPNPLLLEGDDSLGQADTDTGSDGDDTAETEDSGTPTPDMGGAEDTETDTDTDTDTSTEADSSTGDSCEDEAAVELEASDLPVSCSSCLAANCCEQTLACAETPHCPCLVSCLLAGGGNGQCKNACGAPSPNQVPGVQAALDCASSHCDDAC